jgi:uncharacterized protein with HEPN domain
MRSDRERLNDLLETIEKIERYADRGQEVFYSEELVQVWIIYHLQILGEAASRPSSTLRDSHSEVPWARITAMRNILVHHYFGESLHEVWTAATRDVPILKAQILAIEP